MTQAVNLYGTMCVWKAGRKQGGKKLFINYENDK